MISSNSEEYVSNIGSGYLHPISSLCETLNSFNLTGSNEVQASVMEHSYSAAIIILAVLLVESITNEAQVNQNAKLLKPIDYIRETYPSSDFGDILTEVFVVRDVIAHSHIWIAQFYYDQTDMKLISTYLREGYGDKKYKEIVNSKERKTRKLGINVFPTKLSRKDVMIVLKTVTEFLLFHEKNHPKYVGISEKFVRYRGQMIRVIDLVGLMKQVG